MTIVGLASDLLVPCTLLVSVQDIAIPQSIPNVASTILIVNLLCVSITTVAVILRTLEKYVGRCFRVEIFTMSASTICLLAGGFLVYFLHDDDDDRVDRVVSLLLTSLSAAMALICTLLKLYIFAHRSYHSPGTLGRQSVQERQLVLFSIALITYILLTGQLFAGIEKWAPHDGIYFIMTTIFTIGIGDFVPKTNVGMALLPLVAICGIVLVGFVVFSTRAVIFGYYLQTLVHELENAAENEHPHVYLTGQQQPFHQFSHFDHVRLTRSATTTAVETPQVASHLSSALSTASSSDPVQVIQSRHLKSQFLLAFVLFSTVVGLFSTILTLSEDWSFFTSAFFVFTTFATIGYGTPSPQTSIGRAAFVWFVVVGVGGLGWLSSILSEALDVWWERIMFGVQARVWRRSVIRSLKSEDALLNIPEDIEQGTGESNVDEYVRMTPGHRVSDPIERRYLRRLSSILSLPGYRVLRPRSTARRRAYTQVSRMPIEEQEEAKEEEEPQYDSDTIDALCLATSGDAPISPSRSNSARTKGDEEQVWLLGHPEGDDAV